MQCRILWQWYHMYTVSPGHVIGRDHQHHWMLYLGRGKWIGFHRIVQVHIRVLLLTINTETKKAGCGIIPKRPDWVFLVVFTRQRIILGV